MSRTFRITVIGACMAAMWFTVGASAREYKVGDSVEITSEAVLDLHAQPGNASQAPVRALGVAEGNTFDVEGIKTIGEERWLKIRVFLKLVTEQSERYKTVGRGWVTHDQLDGRAQHESSSWSSGAAAHSPSKLPTPTPPVRHKPQVSPAPTQRSAGGTPAEAVKAAPGGGPGLTQAQTTNLAAQFRQLNGGGVKTATAILQGGMVTMVVQVKGEAAIEDAQAIGSAFLSLFRPYNYKYLVYVTDERGKTVTNGKQDVGAASIAWADPKIRK